MHPYTNRPPVYLCAPFHDVEAAGIERNVRRATALARLALAEGLHPVSTHATGWLSGMSDLGEGREVALGWGVGLVRLVAKGNLRGRIWLLHYDDGTVSSGCRAELAERFPRTLALFDEGRAT